MLDAARVSTAGRVSNCENAATSALCTAHLNGCHNKEHPLYHAQRQHCRRTCGLCMNHEAIIGLRPIIWLHVPKTGSSFATALTQFACDAQNKQDVIHTIKELGVETSCWNRRCGKGSFLRFTSGHHPLWGLHVSEPTETKKGALQVCDDQARVKGNQTRKGQCLNDLPRTITDQDLSHVVMMVREPKQRIVSGWKSNKHDCPWSHPCQANVHNYTQHAKNCMAQMLVGQNCGSTKPFTASVADLSSRVTRFGENLCALS
jgi:hypothetical protein